jgi:26-hydroxylase
LLTNFKYIYTLFIQQLQGEVNDLILNLQGHLNQSVDLEEYFGISVSNVICSLLMSERFTKEDPKFVKFNRMIQEGMILFGKINLVEYFPIIEYLPYVQTVKCQIADNRKMMFQYYKEVIDRHRKTFDKENIRDVIDFYLLEIANADEQKSSQQSGLFEGVDEDEQIMQIIGDLFSAGMETIRTTLSWLIVYMLRNPSTKLKIQEELDRVVGRYRMPTMDDKVFLPHTGKKKLS